VTMEPICVVSAGSSSGIEDPEYELQYSAQIHCMKTVEGKKNQFNGELK
jgi:hypothetical protein